MMLPVGFEQEDQKHIPEKILFLASSITVTFRFFQSISPHRRASILPEQLARYARKDLYAPLYLLVRRC